MMDQMYTQTEAFQWKKKLFSIRAFALQYSNAHFFKYKWTWCMLIFMVFPTNERKETQKKMKMNWGNTRKLNNKKQVTTKMDDGQIQYRKQVYHKSHTKRRKKVSNQWLIIQVAVVYRTKFVRLCYFFVSFFLKFSQAKRYTTFSLYCF